MFFPKESSSIDPLPPHGWVEVQIQAELLTSFQKGKKSILLNRKAKKQIEIMLWDKPIDPNGRYSVMVKETEAFLILEGTSWEILPFLKAISFQKIPKEQYEILY
jgi:hypothetical protein